MTESIRNSKNKTVRFQSPYWSFRIKYRRLGQKTNFRLLARTQENHSQSKNKNVSNGNINNPVHEMISYVN